MNVIRFSWDGTTWCAVFDDGQVLPLNVLTAAVQNAEIDRPRCSACGVSARLMENPETFVHNCWQNKLTAERAKARRKAEAKS